MKKTLIALTLTASAAVPGHVMASGWEQNGGGSAVELGGTLTPVEKVTPWEVKTGDAITDLDAPVQKGQQVVEIKVNKPIFVLGIRNMDSGGFKGTQGVTPQINYSGVVDTSGFSNGVTTLTLPVHDTSGNPIGTLTAPFSAAGIRTYDPEIGEKDVASSSVFAPNNGDLFHGGIANDMNKAAPPERALAILDNLSPELREKLKVGDWSEGRYVYGPISVSSIITFASYGGGIESGNKITITLKENVKDDSLIQWRATLPVAVYYM